METWWNLHVFPLPLPFRFPQDLLISVGLPEATVQHLSRRVVDLLPAVEAAALAQRAHSVGEGVVHVMEPLRPAGMEAMAYRRGYNMV